MDDSASLLVVMYLLGRIGAPPAAEMNAKVGTFSLEDSCAKAIAISIGGRFTSVSNNLKKKKKKNYELVSNEPESLFMSS